MTDHQTVAAWLDAYVSAWKTYDPEAIGALFSADAVYRYGPFNEPLRGRKAIVADWLINPDDPNRFEAAYHPIAVDGDIAIANGRSRYFSADGTTLDREFDNIFVLRFDSEGRCADFCEWYMEPRRPG